MKTNSLCILTTMPSLSVVQKNSRRLPLALQRNIQDCLWGHPDDWKQKLDIVRVLGTQGYHALRDVSSYISYSNYIESEDSLYCGCCGEKRLCFALAFTMQTCLDCHAQMRTNIT